MSFVLKKKIVKLVSHEIHLKTSQFRLTCKSRMTLWQQVHAFYNVECTTNFFSKISSIDNISPGRASYGVVLNKFCLINFPCHDKCSKVQVYPQKIQHVWLQQFLKMIVLKSKRNIITIKSPTDLGIMPKLMVSGRVQRILPCWQLIPCDWRSEGRGRLPVRIRLFTAV